MTETLTFTGGAILLTSLVVLAHIIMTHKRITNLQTQAAKDTTAIDDILIAMLKED